MEGLRLTEIATLPARNGWRAPIILENPKDAYPSWPLYPFDHNSEQFGFENWANSFTLEPDPRPRCSPTRSELASLRRLDFDVAPHGPDWRMWRATLIAKCDQRRSEVAYLSINDLCDILDHIDIPDELKLVANGIRRVADWIQPVDDLDDKHKRGNDLKYRTGLAADLLLKAHGLARHWHNIGLGFSFNGAVWFYDRLADIAGIPVPDSSDAKADVLRNIADMIAPVAGPECVTFDAQSGGGERANSDLSDGESRDPAVSDDPAQRESEQAQRRVPEYDRRTKTLTFEGKSAQWTARANRQLRIIEVFEDDGWPGAVTLKFASSEEKGRNIRRLNKKLRDNNVRIEFHGNGDKNSVGWRISSSPSKKP